MKKYRNFVILFILITIPFFAYSQDTSPSGVCPPNKICNPFKGGDDLMSLITTLLKNVVMPIAAIASVLYIIWAGFQYVQARGNPGKITEANKNLLWVLIGVGVLLGAAGISEVVQNTIKALIN